MWYASIHLNPSPPVSEVINDEVESYLHTIIRWGIRLKVWYYYGNTDVVTLFYLLLLTIRQTRARRWASEHAIGHIAAL